MSIENLGIDTKIDSSAEFVSQENDEIHLVDILLVIAKNRRTIGFTTLMASVVVALYSLTMPNIYTATSRILPPQQPQSTATMLLGQLGGALGGLGATAGRDLGIKNPSAMYVGMLQSRTIADDLIQQFHLDKVYRTKRESDTRQTLAENTDVSDGTDGIITINVDSKDPKLAADLANGYTEKLQELMSRLAIGEAGQRRLFFEKQLKSAKEDLANAEVALKTTQEKTGILQLDSQARVIIESVASVRAQIAAKEVQLSAMQSFATPENPDYVRTQNELTALRAQLARLEQSQPEGHGNVQIPTENVPSAGLEYVRRLRDVKYYETLFDVMAKQYEAAKLDESKSSGVVQVLDPAVVPDKKSKPKRSILVLFTALISCILATMFVFVREALRFAAQDPQEAPRWQMLRACFRRPAFHLTPKQ